MLEQSTVFLKQNPGEAHLNKQQLKDIVDSNNCSSLFSKISHYAGNVTGTNSYWNKRKDDLKAIIAHAGPPTFFFTFSAADMHWPELHDLFGGPSTSQVRRQNVINNPHLVDWFFTHRIESFIKHWLYDTLDAAWHWYRYEYQARRGSIHCHGTQNYKNDPGLCNLSETALKGFLPEKIP